MEVTMTEVEKAIENLSHAISACNGLDWKPGDREPYLLEAAREVVRAASPQRTHTGDGNEGS
jgi:hypothetical protein